MTASEDQTEAIILDLSVSNLLVRTDGILDPRFTMRNDVVPCSIEASAPAYRIDRLETSR